jgi:hypothetical protein
MFTSLNKRKIAIKIIIPITNVPICSIVLIFSFPTRWLFGHAWFL